MNNYADLAKYIKDKNQLPISLTQTKETLEKRRKILALLRIAKTKSAALTDKMYEIGKTIIDVKKNGRELNKSGGSVTTVVKEFVKENVSHDVLRCKKCATNDNREICHDPCACNKNETKSCS